MFAFLKRFLPAFESQKSFSMLKIFNCNAGYLGKIIISNFQSVYQFSVTVDYEVGIVGCKNDLAIELCLFYQLHQVVRD